MPLRFLAFLGNVRGALALVGSDAGFRKSTNASRRVGYPVYVLGSAPDRFVERFEAVDLYDVATLVGKPRIVFRARDLLSEPYSFASCSFVPRVQANAFFKDNTAQCGVAIVPKHAVLDDVVVQLIKRNGRQKEKNEDEETLIDTHGPRIHVVRTCVRDPHDRQDSLGIALRFAHVPGRVLFEITLVDGDEP